MKQTIRLNVNGMAREDESNRACCSSTIYAKRWA